MNCPRCEQEKNEVIDTRKYQTVILRVRRCMVCMNTFETQELLFIPQEKNTQLQNSS